MQIGDIPGAIVPLHELRVFGVHGVFDAHVSAVEEVHVLPPQEARIGIRFFLASCSQPAKADIQLFCVFRGQGEHFKGHVLCPDAVPVLPGQEFQVVNGAGNGVLPYPVPVAGIQPTSRGRYSVHIRAVDERRKTGDVRFFAPVPKHDRPLEFNAVILMTRLHARSQPACACRPAGSAVRRGRSPAPRRVIPRGA